MSQLVFTATKFLIDLIINFCEIWASHFRENTQDSYMKTNISGW